MPGTTSVPATSNQDVNGVLSGIRWNATNLTFSFPSSGSFYGSGYGNNEPSSFQPLNATQQAAVRSALTAYSSVIGVTFTEITESASQHADLRFSQSNVPSTAWGYYPNADYAEGGDSWYNFSSGYYANPVRGNYAWTTFLHEIGHTLGLDHGHDGVYAMTYAHDSMEYSVMTYRSYEGASTTSGYVNESWGFAQTLMMYDIAALQHMYGANFATNSGNTVYAWTTTTGELYINGVAQGAPGANRIFATVWDGGGADTYDFSNYTTGLTVSLRPGEWTTTSTTQLARLHYSGSVLADGNIANALMYNGDLRSLIENAYGGSGNDSIVGNLVANNLRGNGGNDTLNGAEGDDTLQGGAGNDSLLGGTGTDYARYFGLRSEFNLVDLGNATYLVNDLRSGDPEGNDTVSSIEYFTFNDGTVSLGVMLGVAPVATINDHSVVANQWSQVDSWVSYSDADGQAAVQYQFYDGGTAANSGYFWTPGGGRQDPLINITVNAVDLDDVQIRGGLVGGSETMQVRAFDGINWGAWDAFTFTTLPNTPPVATVNDHSVVANQWSQVDSWVSYSDADGQAAVQYQFYDGGTAANSGYFWTPGGGRQDPLINITVNAADLDDVQIRGGLVGGSETMQVRAFDGINWGAWDAFTFTTLPNTTPVATINDHSVVANQWSQVDSWVSYSDADGQAAVQYQFYDGGTAASSGYFWTPGGGRQDPLINITVNAADLDDVQIRGGLVGGSETMQVRAFDGINWGAWDAFTFTTLPNTTPVATINDHSVVANQWSQVDSWVSYSDADGQAAVQYQFYDGGTAASSGYFWTPGGGRQDPLINITVNAADLDDVQIRGGLVGGSETMQVRAFDGINWGAWDAFTFTTLPNTPPVATVNDHSVVANQWSQVDSWVSYSDADGQAAVQYQFYDGGTAANSGYFWTPGGGRQDPLINITVNAADLDDVQIRGGLVGGSETMQVRAFDGINWGAWDAFTFTTLPNTTPVATINDHSVVANQWSQVDSWVSYSDADGQAAVQYQFYDGGTAASSGYFWTPGGGRQDPLINITVNAADLDDVQIRGGLVGGSETMQVRAFDGINWGAWDAFTFTTLPNTPPVATVNDHSVVANQWSQVDSWVSYSDADGQAAVQYQFYDGGTAASSGYFWTPGGGRQDPLINITVNAADLDDVQIRGGLVGGSETMQVRAFDGINWGAWDAFTFTTLPNTPPVATVNDHSVVANQWSQVDSWVSYSDADGQAAVQYQFYDGGTAANSGYFWTPGGGRQDPLINITVNAADLDDVQIRGGLVGGSETMQVRAFDGINWGAWDAFTFTTLPNTTPVATINDHSVVANQWSQVDSWVSYSDADGQAAVQYQFYDGGTAASSGYFWTPGGGRQDPLINITVNAADLDDVQIRGGLVGGSETMQVRAFDGINWGAWDAFTFTTLL